MALFVSGVLCRLLLAKAAGAGAASALEEVAWLLGELVTVMPVNAAFVDDGVWAFMVGGGVLSAVPVMVILRAWHANKETEVAIKSATRILPASLVLIQHSLDLK